jgi:homoserine O-acetyltransferase
MIITMTLILSYYQRDANNVLAMLWTWQNADISDNEIYKGDFKMALGAIKAKSLVMPGARDLYFPPVDNEWECQHMTGCGEVAYHPIPGDWGHFAGGGANPEDTTFIDNKIKILLSS